MTTHNQRDLEVAWELYDQVQDAGQQDRIVGLVVSYREECVRVERERVLLAIESVMVCSPWQYAEETVEQLRVILEKLEK